jgi:heme/copper-type cytochrome/quinol oxidase subunit 1
MADGVNKFLGDSIARTIVKLIVVCLIVGFVLAFFGYTPDNIVGSIRYHFYDILYNGFDALGDIGNYLVLGAIVVIPVFVVLRLMSYRR